MNRIELIQKLIQKNKFKTYLEIGSRSGNSFLPIKCKSKLAVDPKFAIPRRKKLKWLYKNLSNIRNRYFEETSDEFFINRMSLLTKIKSIDVILIDGLHTFKASLTDVLNSLKYLNSNGYIVLHDCLPKNKAAATYAASYEIACDMNIEGWTGHWNGDVWKTIVYLRKYYSDSLDVIVLNTDYGLGIVKWKNEVPKVLNYNESQFLEINKMSYDDLILDLNGLLGLKNNEFTSELFAK